MRRLIKFILLISIVFVGCSPYGEISRNYRTIEFSGLTWVVKQGEEKLGPGPNYFGGGTDQVWVDNQGFLHLKLKRINGRWNCAEVYTTRKFGSGKYSFQVASRIDNIDPNIVVGLFTWNDRMAYHNQEVDIEFSKWGQPGNRNTQYVVQPYTIQRNMNRFNTELNGSYSTHEFTIGPRFVFFESYHGHPERPLPGTGINNWLYHCRKGPFVRNAEIRINVWLFRGLPPSDGQEQEVIIRRVKYTPLMLLWD